MQKHKWWGYIFPKHQTNSGKTKKNDIVPSVPICSLFNYVLLSKLEGESKVKWLSTQILLGWSAWTQVQIKPKWSSETVDRWILSTARLYAQYSGIQQKPAGNSTENPIH